MACGPERAPTFPGLPGGMSRSPLLIWVPLDRVPLDWVPLDWVPLGLGAGWPGCWRRWAWRCPWPRCPAPAPANAVAIAAEPVAVLGDALAEGAEVAQAGLGDLLSALPRLRLSRLALGCLALG